MKNFLLSFLIISILFACNAAPKSDTTSNNNTVVKDSAIISGDQIPKELIDLNEKVKNRAIYKLEPELYRTYNMSGIKNIEEIKLRIESIENVTPEEFWIQAHSFLKHDLFALCALDIAYNDLYARKKEKKLYE